MKFKNKMLTALAVFFISNCVFADIIPMNLTIINNTSRTFNVMQGMNFNNLGPIVQRHGGSAQWTMNVNSNLLTTLGIYYSAASYAQGCSAADRQNGAFALNPAIYKGDQITITITTGTDGRYGDYPICACSGSACDIGFAASRKKE
jgi:hypothetical protein